MIADVVGNLRADGLCVLGIFRKKCQAASGIGELGQGGPGFLHGAAVVLEVVIAEYAYRINHRVVPLRLFDGILQAMTTGVVFAVGHNKNHLLSRVPFFR